jgi:hypothetical protein
MDFPVTEIWYQRTVKSKGRLNGDSVIVIIVPVHTVRANGGELDEVLLLLFIRAQGICPRCTSACRLIVLP